MTDTPDVTPRRRHHLAVALVVVAALLGVVATVGRWSEDALFDSSEFASRVTTSLDSRPVRDALAVEIVDQLTESGTNDLVPYQPILLAVTEVVVGTDAFRSVFRQSVEAAHRLAFDENDDQFLLNLTDALGLIADSLAVVQPEIAEEVGEVAPRLLVDGTETIRGYVLWQRIERIDTLTLLAGVSALLAGLGAVLLAPTRRWAFIRLSAAVICAGVGVVVLASAVPAVVASFFGDPLLASSVRELTRILVEDLRVAGISLAAYGAIGLAVAATPVGTAHAVDPAAPWQWAWEQLTRRQTSTPAGLARGVLLIVIGWQLVANPDVVATVAGILVGLFLGFLGTTQLVQVVGRRAELAALAHVKPTERTAVATIDQLVRRRVVLSLGIVVVTLFGVVTLAGLFTVGGVRDTARADSALACNGHPELCERRLDEVTFAGSHNSMGAVRSPGWLFAEHNGDIADQLDYGIRALLIDTYYGVPTDFVPPGSSVPIVLTDRTASEAVGVGVDSPGADSLPEGADDRAAELSALAAPSARGTRDVYLCHNHCELGATPLREVLADLRAFLDRNPAEVVLLFLQDYVAPADLSSVFDDVGLAERMWLGPDDEDDGELPRLRELITSRRQIIVLSENTGPPPAWYLSGFELTQDTPYSFATPRDFSCAPNRGPDDAPLLLVNHWLDTGRPSVPADGRLVNTAEVLGQRARGCARERGMQPTILAVNWYDQGDLLEVVDDLNGVRTDREAVG